ncbi:MAG TPA: GNAT family N-acetyltransferase [Actinomycetaceae bacterium]|nr:GNAT family N-acetyltransferase [Actinomycetaceae bacterium]
MDPSHTVQLGDRHLTITRATEADVPTIVALLADDELGASRESTDSADRSRYLAAFAEIDSDSRHLLVAVRDESGAVVATMHLTLLPGLSRQAATRLQIEAVRVGDSARGLGLGTRMIEWAHQYGREHGARLVQLTTDRSRTDAHRFYQRLGYVATHEGFKLEL